LCVTCPFDVSGSNSSSWKTRRWIAKVRIAKDLHDDWAAVSRKSARQALHQNSTMRKKVEGSVRPNPPPFGGQRILGRHCVGHHPRHDTLPELIGHLGSPAWIFAAGRPEMRTWDLPHPISPLLLTPEQRHNLTSWPRSDEQRRAPTRARAKSFKN